MQRQITPDQFVAAAGEGNLAIVRQYIQENANNLNALNVVKGEFTALIAAVVANDGAMVEELIRTPGLRIDQVNSFGSTALSAAKAIFPEFVPIIQDALERLDIHAEDRLSQIGYEAPVNASQYLTAARRGDIYTIQTYLFQNRDNPETVNVTQVEADNASALYYAANKNHLHIVELLLQQPNTDVNILSYGRITPLMTAIFGKHTEVAKALIRDARTDFTIENYNRNNALQEAVRCQLPDIAQLISELSGVPLILPETNTFPLREEPAEEIHEPSPQNSAILEEDGDLNAALAASLNEPARPPATPHTSVGIKPKGPTFQERLAAINCEDYGAFEDPIMQSCIINDPISPDGEHTFDRESLSNYFLSLGNPETAPCPLTRKPIALSKLLMPSHVLTKHLLEAFVKEKEAAAAKANSVYTNGLTLFTTEKKDENPPDQPERTLQP